MRLRGEVLLDSGMYNGLGLIVAFLGIGCAACGSAFLSVVLSLLGFSSMLSYLPYGGEEIGYIGLLFLFMATYHLSKKVNSPLTC
jgi:Na+/alanine symporter